MYGVELKLVETAPVEDTVALAVNSGNTAVTDPGTNGTDGKVYTGHYGGGSYVFFRSDDTVTHTISVNATATYDLYFIYNSGANLTVTANNGAPIAKTVSMEYVYKWDGTKSTQPNSSLSSSANYVKISGVPLRKGENTVTVKNSGHISYGAVIAVRQATTVTLYDQDGETPISVQKVYDISDVVYPKNVKVPSGYDDVSGWSDLTYDEATGGYSSTVAYGKYYNVDFYDYDKTTLLASMKIAVGSDNAGPDMSGDKNFKGWSTPLSEVNSDCSVYAVRKQENASVSASDVILASASFAKVAEGATYSDYEGYYTVVATETDGFVAGEVYTQTDDGYALALADTGDTYYTLAVTPAVATSTTTLTDYYTYSYTLAEDSPVKIVAASREDDFYTPATATTSAAVFFPNLSGIKPSTTYVSVFVTVDYSGYYEVNVGTKQMYSHYASLRNVTTVEQNPNIEAFMTNRVGGNRISGTKVSGNKANALFASATKSYNMGYIYLAEGLNEIRLFHDCHSNNGTGSAFSTVDFTLLRKHDAENSLSFEISTAKAAWQYDEASNDTHYGSGQGFIRLEPSAKTGAGVYKWNVPYDILGNVTLATDTSKTIYTATEIPEGKTPKTRAVTLKAGTYTLIEYINSAGHKVTYTFTKADDASVSVTETSSATSTEAKMGHSYAAFKEVSGPTVTIPEDGTYNVSVVAMYAPSYVTYAMFHLVPVTEDVTTHTVKFYDGNGNLLSVQSVADGMAATAPEVDTKNFLAWSEDFSTVTADMEIYAIYDVRYTVEYYDNEANLLLTESVFKGDAAKALDYSRFDKFKGWSTSPDEYIAADISSVTEDMKVYLFMKQANASVSASDAILASASYHKVAEGATYSDYEGYYTVVATETDGFVAGEVYTQTDDGYALALADTGDTYYTLAVTPAVATSTTTLTDYYTYSYTLAEDSPVKIVAASREDDFYTPATATTSAAVFFPNLSGIKPSTTYVSVFVTVDYSGYYEVNVGTKQMYSHYASLRNVTTVEQNPNIEAFMTNRVGGNRISGTKVSGNKANALFASATKSYNMGYIYLAEGLNEIRLFHDCHSNNGTGSAFSTVDFTLLRKHDAENSLSFEISTAKAAWQYDEASNDTHYGSGQGFIRLEPSAKTGAGVYKWNVPYDILGNVTLATDTSKTIYTATEIPEGKTPKTRAVTLKAGTYTLIEYINSAGHKVTYTFTKADDASVSVTETSSATSTEAKMGHSYAAFKEVSGPTVTIPEDGTYNVSVVAMYAPSYVTYAMFHLVPVEADTHTVKFVDSDGKTPISVQTVQNGEAAVAPDMTGDEGFLYWDTDFSEITGDVTVTAVRRHTVTFRTYDGTLIVRKETVTGGTVIAPEAPLRDGYLFTGWSKDFSAVTGDLSIRATYKEKERFTVTFVGHLGETLMTETVYTGDAVTPPEYTAPDGYLFLGWSDDTSAVLSNMTVLARTAATTLTAENLNGTGTTTVEAGEGTLETLFLPVGTANYIEFNVTADVEGYYALNLQMNDGDALLKYVRVKNTSATTYEKNYYGVGRVNNGSSKASVTVDNCMVAEGTAYTNDILHVYLHADENTLHLSTIEGASFGVAAITMTLVSGDKLADGDYYAVYDKYEKSAGTGFIAAESDFSAAAGLASGNDYYSGGVMLRNDRYITHSATLTIAEDGYYALHGIMAAGDSIVTLTDVNDPENVVVFNAANLGQKGGTASSPFWHGTRDTQNIYAGTYKVKVASHGNHVYTAYYLTREGELDGVYNVGTENATLGEGVERLENGVSVMLPGTASGYIDVPVTADRDGLFRVEFAASTQGVALDGLYAVVNGKTYTLSPAQFGSAGDQYLNISFDKENCLYVPLTKGENTVRFYTARGERMAIAGMHFAYDRSLIDGEIFTGDTVTLAGTSATATVLGAGTATKNADHLAITSTSNTNGADLVYTFSVDSARTVYFNMTMETTLGTVFLYTLTDASGNTLRDTFYAVNYDTVGVETLNIDIFEFLAAGEYTLTVKMRRSPMMSLTGQSAEVGPTVKANIYSLEFMPTAKEISTPDASTGDVTQSSVTGATLIGNGASITFTNVPLYRNAGYALRLFGRVSGGTVVTVSYTGAGNILESDYFYDQLFSVTSITEIAANNETVYEYNTRTGRYVLATEYVEGTVYYVKDGRVTPSSGSITFTATEDVNATQWFDLGNLNLLADTYTVTVTVADGSLAVDKLAFDHTADYLRVIELDRSAVSQTDANEVRVAILADNHYGTEAGSTTNDSRQNELIDTLLYEYHTAESLDATFFAADFVSLRMNTGNTMANGQIYYYSMTYLVENIMRRMQDAGLPYFVTHSGHDYKSNEEWYDLFGYEKNYVVVIGDAAFICLDYYYNQADTLVHESTAAQVDISEEVRDQILAVLEREDIAYASVVTHYAFSSSYPNIAEVYRHEKVNASFGGHTHYNHTKQKVEVDEEKAFGKTFLQIAHYAHTSGATTAGYCSVIDPHINLTSEGYFRVLGNVTQAATATYQTADIGSEYFSANYATPNASGTWQTAAYTTDGKKIIFFRNEALADDGSYVYYVIDGDGVYLADLTNATNETVVASYESASAANKSIDGLVFGVDYYRVASANGSDVVIFANYDTTSGKANVTAADTDYYLVNADGSLSLLTGVTLSAHGIAAAHKQTDFTVSGLPRGFRIYERVNGTERDIVESYFVYMDLDDSYKAWNHGYMRIRPSDMGGYADRTYALVEVLEKN